MQQRPRRKVRVPSTRPITTRIPQRRRNSPTSPTCFMALERRTSPDVEASTTAKTEHHVYSSFMPVPHSKLSRVRTLLSVAETAHDDDASSVLDRRQQNPQQ